MKKKSVTALYYKFYQYADGDNTQIPHSQFQMVHHIHKWCILSLTLIFHSLSQYPFTVLYVREDGDDASGIKDDAAHEIKLFFDYMINDG